MEIFMKILGIYLFVIFGSTVLLGYLRTDRTSMGAMPPPGSTAHYMFKGFPIITFLIGVAVMSAAYKDKGPEIFFACSVIAAISTTCVAWKIHRGYGPTLVILGFPFAVLAACAAIGF
jgi:hypothetical protein